MGLFDMFKKKAEPAAAAAPASISASAGADVLCSPVKGKVIKMADVPDPVFGGEVLGKGCAVWPEDDLVYAPCDGKVTVTMVTPWVCSPIAASRFWCTLASIPST